MDCEVDCFEKDSVLGIRLLNVFRLCWRNWNCGSSGCL